MRTIVYDVETTGKNYLEGHRIVEIAAIEIVDGVMTDNYFHEIINPDRHIPEELLEKGIHAVTDEVVKGKPRFKDISQRFIDFMRGANAVAHNAGFDEKFINNELKIIDHPESFWSIVGDTTDTMFMSQKIWVGINPEDNKKYGHSLDKVVARCGVDGSARVLHGALIDSQLLGQVYLKMQAILAERPTLADDVKRSEIKRIDLAKPLPAVSVSAEQLQAHQDFFGASKPSMKM